MKTELIQRLTMAELEQAHAAYTRLAVIYERVCDGPRNARAYREYYGIMESRDKIRQEYEHQHRLAYGFGEC